MSALRRAGVWLGLVEEVDEPAYGGAYADGFAEDEDDFTPPARANGRTRAARSTDRGPLGDPASGERDHRGRAGERDLRGTERSTERAGERTTEREPRSGDPRGERRIVDRDRYEEPRAERASIRQLARSGSTSTSYPTQDNLALAPQVQLRERAVVSDDKSRRYQITTLHPTTYTEARSIGEHFRDGAPVIINLTEMDEPDARRIVDFAAGLAFGLRGSIERVTNRVFLLSPPNVQVTAEDKAKIAEGGFFDQG
jgi:cell division inhibitor SepF